jgi:argininosuccinate lyase
MRFLIDEIRFIPENIAIDESVYAAGQANRLVLEEGISFREAYRRVAQELTGED